MKIGEASRLSGCHIETIRYYERVSILSPTARSESGYRRYTDHHIQQLRFIHHTRELDFSPGRYSRTVVVERTTRSFL